MELRNCRLGVRLKRSQHLATPEGVGKLGPKDPRRLASAEGPGLLSFSASWVPLAPRQRHHQVDRSAPPRTPSGARKPPCSPPVWKEIQVGGGRSWRNAEPRYTLIHRPSLHETAKASSWEEKQPHLRWIDQQPGREGGILTKPAGHPKERASLRLKLIFQSTRLGPH